MKYFIAAVIAVALSSVAYYYDMQPKTYEECVLKNIDKAENSVAATIVTKTCRKQFPETYVDETTLFQKD